MGEKLIYIVFIAFSWCFNLNGQIESTDKITLTGELDEDRQVIGISSSPNEENQAVNAFVLQSNYLKYAVSTGDGNNVDINLNIPATSYVEGMALFVKINQPNTGNVQLNVNSLGYIPLKKNVSDDLLPNELKTNQIIHVIFDGNNFQLLSDTKNACPAGFAEVNDGYCIEIDERAPARFYDAIETCGSINAKLCSWDDWYYACQKVDISPALNDMTGVWEWVDAGGNNYNPALSNSNTAHVVGETGCTNHFTEGIRIDATNDFVLLPYRCCYKK